MTACIVGWAHSPFGKLADETVESLIVKVATEALEHAGIGPDDVDEIVLGHFNGGFSQQDFTASLVLRRVELSDASIRRVLLRYPLMTAKVIGAIHWEALKLWWKGAPFHSQPKYDPESARQGVA